MKHKILKNHLILGLLFILVLVLMLYIKLWVDTYKEEKYSKSYLTDKVEEIKLSELEVTTKEMNDVFLLVTKTGNKKIYKQEQELYEFMKKHNVINNFIYLDVTNDKDYIINLNNIYSNIEIDDVPFLIFIKNGTGVKVINNNGKIETKFIEQIINEYEL